MGPYLKALLQNFSYGLPIIHCMVRPVVFSALAERHLEKKTPKKIIKQSYERIKPIDQWVLLPLTM